jgi:hypothetical protein
LAFVLGKTDSCFMGMTCGRKATYKPIENKSSGCSVIKSS